MFDFYTIKLQINFHSYVFFLNFLYRTHVVIISKFGQKISKPRDLTRPPHSPLMCIEKGGYSLGASTLIYMIWLRDIAKRRDLNYFTKNLAVRITFWYCILTM